MKSKPVPARSLKQLDSAITVWAAHDDFTVGPDITLKKAKDTRTQLDSCLNKLIDLRRQVIEQTDLRDDYARTANDMVVRIRKGIAGFYGPDSTQYAQAGGTRSSERKTPTRKNQNAELKKAA